MEPILKWAGGKRNLLPKLIEIIDESGFDQENNKYFEPFIGGGALCFNQEFSNSIINDYNKELINVYRQVKEHPHELISLLEEHQTQHSKEHYLSVREMDRKKEYEQMNNLDKAARIIYLNRTCYNGLYRVNKKGYFNVPMGNYKNPEIVMKDRITELSKYLNEKNVGILEGDFEKAVANAKEGDLIYFDPPYDYEENGFSTYTANGFDHNELKRLKEVADKLVKKGCIVLISNNETKFVEELFDETWYKVHRVQATRFISCDGKSRSKANEVIIYGRN